MQDAGCAASQGHVPLSSRAQELECFTVLACILIKLKLQLKLRGRVGTVCGSIHYLRYYRVHVSVCSNTSLVKFV